MSTTPQENQPGEAAQDLVGPEPQAQCHTPPNVEDGVKRHRFFIMTDDLIRAIQVKFPGAMNGKEPTEVYFASDYDSLKADWGNMAGELAAERAKRMALEKDRCEVCNAELTEYGDISGEGLSDCLQCRMAEDIKRLRAELLALRGGEGRKVSSAAWEWLSFRHEEYSNAAQAIREGSDDYEDEADQYDLLAGYARELLCVLSEEGGRQKEGVGCSQKSLEDQIDTMLNVASGLRAQLLAEQERVKKLVDLVEDSCMCITTKPLENGIRETLAEILSPPPVVGPRQDAD